ncbi:MAG: nickel pincer cofactor biosynthesis protein LarB [Planctomycetota bacterium]
MVARGDLSIADARARLAPAFADLGFARIDHERAERCGFPEVIFCSGKSPEQVLGVARELLAHSDRLLATRASPEVFATLQNEIKDARYHALARTITVERGAARPRTGQVLVITAGTADIPVAEEARVTAAMMDARVDTLYDAGVAGIHRLLADLDRLRQARALVVCAGMEGALPSVVGGLVARPVIAVPTSVGYGASFGGIAALLGMLNSCAAGVSVVNIDNGFGAGYIAAMINQESNPDAGSD